MAQEHVGTPHRTPHPSAPETPANAGDNGPTAGPVPDLDSWTPRISVLVPAYNAAATLGATLTSLLVADYPDLEVIVVDDGSQDATAELAAVYARHWPEGNSTGRCVRVIRQENKGIAGARNAAIAVATGAFYALVDADDQVMPDYFITSLRALRRAGADPRYFDPRRSRKIVANNAYLLTPSGINRGRVLLREPLPAPEQQPSRILTDNVGSILSVFPRELIEQVGPFDEQLRYCEDWDLWIRAVRAGWRIVRQNRPTALYRWTGGSASSERSPMYRAQEIVLRKALTAGGLTDEERDRLTARLSGASPSAMMAEVEMALRRGEYRPAGRRLREASRQLPTQRRVRLKAWATRIPGGTRLLGRRQRTLDARVGFVESMQR